MTDYDFKTLNDKEFEVFCAHLLGKANGVKIERFKAGRDGGVDGRFFASPGQEVILQCKHWANTPITQLIAHLAKEKPKLDKLKPARYLVAVSNALSHADKTAIAANLGEHLKTVSDIFGKEDLNDLLKDYPDIERNHYKLWLSSYGVISHVFNKPMYDRSTYFLKEAFAKAKRYVTTANHDRALAKLESLGVVIIAGEPGIGKTTLAENICLHYVCDDYELLKIEEDIKEAEAVFQEKKKQIFYFDDFLGRNYFEALSGHAGSKIVGFIRRVAAEKDCKRFVLTSRSTVLNQGKVLMDCFEHQNLNRNEFEISVATLSEMDRARILYNHIWHAELPNEYVAEIYRDKRYRKIVHHKNYNPRLISFVTDYTRLEGVSANDYWPRIEASLDNPVDVWQNPFDAQQDDYGRAITLLVTLNRKPISEDVLSQAYSEYISFPAHQGLHGRRDFMINLRHLCGSLLIRRIEPQGKETLDLFNPALGDYVLQRYTKDVQALRLGLLSLRTVSSLQTLDNLFANKMIGGDFIKEVIEAIVKKATSSQFVGYSSEYIAKSAMILGRFIKTSSYGDELKLILKFLENEKLPTHLGDVLGTVQQGAETGLLSVAAVGHWVARACESELDYQMFCILGKLVEYLDVDDPEAASTKKKYDEMAIDFVADSLAEEVSDRDLFCDVGFEDDDMAQEKVESLVEELLRNYGVAPSYSSVSFIMGYFDHSEALMDYHHAIYDRDDGGYASGFVQAADDIDDLFDRS